MPTRLCADRHCPNPATYRGRCAEHARNNEQRTRRAGHALYRSKRWQILRRHILFHRPLCPCGEIATDVDHITALEQGGEPWSPSNLQGLCASCHAIKTRGEGRP